MTRTVRRDVPGQALQAAHLYLASRLAEADAHAAKGDKKKGPYAILAAWCRLHGVKDENDSYTWTFPEPISIGGVTYTGFRLQASQPSPYFDEEAAQALIDSLGPDVVAAATHTEIIYDYDYLFLLRQQEQITSEDLDKVLITPDKTYALTVLGGR